MLFDRFYLAPVGGCALLGSPSPNDLFWNSRAGSPEGAGRDRGKLAGFGVHRRPEAEVVSQTSPLGHLD